MQPASLVTRSTPGQSQRQRGLTGPRPAPPSGVHGQSSTMFQVSMTPAAAATGPSSAIRGASMPAPVRSVPPPLSDDDAPPLRQRTLPPPALDVSSQCSLPHRLPPLSPDFPNPIQTASRLPPLSPVPTPPLTPDKALMSTGLGSSSSSDAGIRSAPLKLNTQLPALAPRSRTVSTTSTSSPANYFPSRLVASPQASLSVAAPGSEVKGEWEGDYTWAVNSPEFAHDSGLMSKQSMSSIATAPPRMTEKPLPPVHSEGEMKVPTKAATLPAPAASSSEAPSHKPAATPTPRRERPKAVAKTEQFVKEKKTVDGTWYLDPGLGRSLFRVPDAITTTADVAFSTVANYPHERYSTVTGAPIDGMAKLAKHYAIPPDGFFRCEDGGMTIRLGVIDEVGGGVTPDAVDKNGKPVLDKQGNPVPVKSKTRTKTRVEIKSKRGGVFFELIEMDPNRQLDMSVTTRQGDILILLPETFLGKLNFHMAEEPEFLTALSEQMAPLTNPYEEFFTTTIFPTGFLPPKTASEQPPSPGASTSKLSAKDQTKLRKKAEEKALKEEESRKSKAAGMSHRILRGVQKYVPEALREQDDYLDMVAGGLRAVAKGSESKIVVTSISGRVVFGLRGADEDEANDAGLKVGAGARKHWWNM